MKESEAFHAAQERADKYGATTFVVTSREAEGHDYQIATAAQLNRLTVVVGMKEPQTPKD